MLVFPGMSINMHPTFFTTCWIISSSAPGKSSKGAGVLEDLGMSGVPKRREIGASLVGWLVGWDWSKKSMLVSKTKQTPKIFSGHVLKVVSSTLNLSISGVLSFK